MTSNIDDVTVDGFGEEWSRFDQKKLGDEELNNIFRAYFSMFPWNELPSGAVGADIGCGSGRWAKVVAPKVGTLHAVDASTKALSVAREQLAGSSNVVFHEASVGALPFEDNSLDFAYSLGVLHHVPDTAEAIRAVAKKLKPGAPLLLYLYYALDGAPFYFRALFEASNVLRQGICQLSPRARFAVTDSIAASVYWPLARGARVLEAAGKLPKYWPLAAYRDKSFYTMRTDALDRFGTKLEQRFTREQITDMLRSAGLHNIQFSEETPYWVSVAYK